MLKLLTPVWDAFIGRDRDPILGPPPALVVLFKAFILSMILLAWLLGLAIGVAEAEPTPLRWDSHTTVAEFVGRGMLGTQMALAVRDAWKAPRRGRAMGCLALENATTILLSELVKHLVHRRRPDGSDNLSFWSEDTALSAVNARRTGPRLGIVVGVALMRNAAGKHHISDVTAGAVAGGLMSQLCRP